MNKKILQRMLLCGACLFILDAFAAAQESARYPVIPRPVKLVAKDGYFTIGSGTKIILDGNDPAIKTAVHYLVELVKNAAGYALPVTTGGQKTNTIRFTLDAAIANEEGYRLAVDPAFISVRAKTPKGIFMAIQTLRQLMPAEIESSQSGFKSFRVPAVDIDDFPRFGYRGIMLDVGRHFFPIAFIRRYIDLLAFYKINTFHLHLTDDQGWRMEIKKYPRLQTISAWRKETQIGYRLDTPKLFDHAPHGGFYTQEELKALVKYAQERFITIIPEIDMPGHMQSALAAYPQFGCKDSTYEVSGEWGIHKDILCPKEETFRFVEDVLTEVMAVFPGKYIHIGGDEAAKDRWKESAFCQALIKKLNLKDEHELQSYFIQRVEKFLNAHGRAMIGWDEILEGGLAPNATVMSWRGEKGGIEAARQKHPVIMTPSNYLYFNFYQTKQGRAIEPLSNAAFLPLDKVYNYNPVPAVLTPAEAAYILGPQGSLWTEYISTVDVIEYMTFPRACALAEVGWTPLANKNYADFVERMKQNSLHLAKMYVQVADYYREDEKQR